MGKIKLSTTEAFNRIKAKHPNIKILSKDYVRCHSLLEFQCRICSYKWRASYANVTSQGTGCPRCSSRLKLSTTEAFNRIKARYPDIEILSNSYASAHGSLEFRCKICKNRWVSSYAGLIHSKGGCAKCGVQKSANAKKISTTEAFNRIKAKHPNIQILSKKYINNHTPLHFKCKICGKKWQAIYTSLMHRGSRCPKCARKMTKGEKHIFDLLISCGLVYCSSLDEALAREKARLTKN